MKPKILLLSITFLLVISCQKENQPPVIQSITASPPTIKTGEITYLSCVATDPDGDPITYTWSSRKGTFPNGTSGSSIAWKAPDEIGEFDISVIVSDGKNVTDGYKYVTISANPILTTTPTSLEFGATATQQTFDIRNSGTGKLTWAISESLTWLSVSPASGETTTGNNSITITVNRNGVSPGNYSGKITVSSNGGTQDVSVTMMVPEEPKLSVTPSSLEFGATSTQQTFDIRNSGTGKLIWTISESLPWLSVSPASGETTSGTNSITVTVNRSGVSPGNYSGKITVSSNGGTQDISVNMAIENTITETFTDTRGGETKAYKTVKIGDQVWMAENLAYLPSVSPSSQGSVTTPHYYVYGYQGTDVSVAKQHVNYITYGVLYNWPAAMAGAASSSANPSKVQGVCPTGWHLPSDAEWKQLEIALGMAHYQADANGWRGTNQGTQLKATSRWASNGNGTNTSGFSALPGGGYYNDAFINVFRNFGVNGFWWSSTEGSSSGAWYRCLSSPDAIVYRAISYKEYGFSVRCVKD